MVIVFEFIVSNVGAPWLCVDVDEHTGGVCVDSVNYTLHGIFFCIMADSNACADGHTWQIAKDGVGG